MKTAEQLKGTIRSIAARKNLRAQEVLQIFFFRTCFRAISKFKLPKKLYS